MDYLLKGKKIIDRLRKSGYCVAQILTQEITSLFSLVESVNVFDTDIAILLNHVTVG